MDTFDPSDFRRFILLYPGQLSLGYKFPKHLQLPKRTYSNVVICALGGSALAGELVENFLSQETNCRIPLIISRGYHIPKNLTNKNSLVLLISYSGTTEETLSCYHEAIAAEATIVTLSNGGALQQLTQQNGGYHVPYLVPIENFEGRFAITYAFSVLLGILTKAGIIDTIKKFPTINTRDLEVIGEAIAQRISGKIPVVYASDQLEAIARSWKIKINENTKTPAFWNVFPEVNHNEMIGFTNTKSPFHVIMLTEKHMDPRISKRMTITRKLLEEKNITVDTILIKGADFMEKMLCGLVLGDWVAYYLAYEYGQDPTPMEMVNALKQRLK